MTFQPNFNEPTKSTIKTIHLQESVWKRKNRTQKEEQIKRLEEVNEITIDSVGVTILKKEQNR